MKFQRKKSQRLQKMDVQFSCLNCIDWIKMWISESKVKVFTDWLCTNFPPYGSHNFFLPFFAFFFGIVNICANYCNKQNILQIFMIAIDFCDNFSVFFALRKNYRKVFALHKIFHKYLRYFLRSAKNTAKICAHFCRNIRSVKNLRTFCANNWQER